MLRTFSKMISTDELKNIINSHKPYDSYDVLTIHTPKDLFHIEFSSENEEAEEYLTLENGLSVLEIWSGGDWEISLHYIIYYDGEKLRAYIPVDGNTYNKTFNSAFGNDIEHDFLELQRIGLIDKNKIFNEEEDDIDMYVTNITDNLTVDKNKTRSEISRVIRFRSKYVIMNVESTSDIIFKFNSWY